MTILRTDGETAGAPSRFALNSRFFSNTFLEFFFLLGNNMFLFALGDNLRLFYIGEWVVVALNRNQSGCHGDIPI